MRTRSNGVRMRICATRARSSTTSWRNSPCAPRGAPDGHEDSAGSRPRQKLSSMRCWSLQRSTRRLRRSTRRRRSRRPYGRGGQRWSMPRLWHSRAQSRRWRRGRRRRRSRSVRRPGRDGGRKAHAAAATAMAVVVAAAGGDAGCCDGNRGCEGSLSGPEEATAPAGSWSDRYRQGVCCVAVSQGRAP